MDYNPYNRRSDLRETLLTRNSDNVNSYENALEEYDSLTNSNSCIEKAITIHRTNDNDITNTDTKKASRRRGRVRYDRILMVFLPIGVLIGFLLGYNCKGALVKANIKKSMQQNVVAQNVDYSESEHSTTAVSTTSASSNTTETTVTSAANENPIIEASAFSAVELEQHHKIYPKELVVVGDSIASGFGNCGFISAAHNLAKGCVGIRSIHDYTFTCQGVEMDITDAVSAIQPAYIYMSMGMNDVNMISSDEYHDLYIKQIKDFFEVSPDSNIILAGITPLRIDSDFSSNTIIRSYNEELKKIVNELNMPNLIYFETHTVLADPATSALRPEYSADDGIHNTVAAYQAIMEALNEYLDKLPYPSNLIKTDLSDLDTTEQ